MILERTNNAKRNIVYGIISKIVSVGFPFIIRTIMLRKIGADYLGLNSLFYSILQVLNITELGFSNAVVYSMYKPIAQDDKETLCNILSYFRKIYFILGFIIAVAAIALMPFLPNLIKGNIPDKNNLYIYYSIYILSTVVSYWLFAYKNSLLNAYQRVDIISKITTLVFLTIYSLQILGLIVFESYYIYLFLMLFGSIATNVLTEIVTKRIFPDLFCKGHIAPELKKEINQKVKGLFVNRICQTSRTALNNIFVAAFLGLVQTAIFSNYYQIMNGVILILGTICPALLAGVGNSIVLDSQEKNYHDMRTINLIYMWITSFCTICLLCLYQPFVEVFFGKEMIFPFRLVLLFCSYFYMMQVSNIIMMYSDANGLWWEYKYYSILETVLNLLLNYFLGKKYGVSGILIGTIITLFAINFIWRSIFIHKHYFTDYKVSTFLSSNLYIFLFLIIVASVTYSIGHIICINVSAMKSFLLNLILCLILPNILFFFFFSKLPEFKEAKKLIKKIVGKKYRV